MLGSYNSIKELPFDFQSRVHGKSKLNIRQQIDYLRHLFSLMDRKGELLRFVKFCLVGISGVGINIGLLWLLTESLGFHYMLSAIISIEASVITNFTLNNFFTFADRNERGNGLFIGRLFKFNITSLVGIAINAGALLFFTEAFGIFYILSSLIGIAMATMWNYLVNNWWTWR